MSDNQTYHIPDCDMPFTSSELVTISQYFKCQSQDEFIKAAQRVDELLTRHTYKHEDGLYLEAEPGLELALRLASILYKNFKTLDKPLEPKIKSSGAPAKPSLPLNTPALFTALKQQHPSMSNVDVVKTLQNQNKLPIEYKPAGLWKKVKKMIDRGSASDDFDVWPPVHK